MRLRRGVDAKAGTAVGGDRFGRGVRMTRHLTKSRTANEDSIL